MNKKLIIYISAVFVLLLSLTATAFYFEYNPSIDANVYYNARGSSYFYSFLPFNVINVENAQYEITDYVTKYGEENEIIKNCVPISDEAIGGHLKRIGKSDEMFDGKFPFQTSCYGDSSYPQSYYVGDIRYYYLDTENFPQEGEYTLRSAQSNMNAMIASCTNTRYYPPYTKISKDNDVFCYEFEEKGVVTVEVPYKKDDANKKDLSGKPYGSISISEICDLPEQHAFAKALSLHADGTMSFLCFDGQKVLYKVA